MRKKAYVQQGAQWTTRDADKAVKIRDLFGFKGTDIFYAAFPAEKFRNLEISPSRFLESRGEKKDGRNARETLSVSSPLIIRLFQCEANRERIGRLSQRAECQVGCAFCAFVTKVKLFSPRLVAWLVGWELLL